MDHRTKEEKKLAKKIRTLLIQCGHPEPYRTYAERDLRELGSKAVPEILSQLADAKSGFRHWPIELFLRLLAMYVLFFGLSLFFARKALSSFWTYALISCIYSVWRLKKTREHATAALTFMGDLRAISAIAEGLQSPRKDVRSLCRDAIRTLLPKLTEANSELLTPEARKSLNDSLLLDDRRLVVPIIAVYRRVGDGSAIPNVESLATARAGLGKTSEEIQTLALSLLPILRERAEHERVSGLLLRAANAPDDQPEMLLRAASNSPQSDNELLLRPTE